MLPGRLKALLPGEGGEDADGFEFAHADIIAADAIIYARSCVFRRVVAGTIYLVKQIRSVRCAVRPTGSPSCAAH